MNRYFAILLALLVLCVPQFASAASVRFGAGLDPNGGHCSGSAADTGSGTPLTGKMHWSGTTITFTNGCIIGDVVTLFGTVTSTNDPALEGASVQVNCLDGADTVIVMVDNGTNFSGVGHVTIR